MAFPDDLIEQAYMLANLETGEPKQASLRRAVSNAYYALFHLILDDLVGHWRIERQRPTIARTCDHGKMKRVCEEHIKYYFSAGEPPELEKLKKVAEAFTILQQQRHTADYDNAFHWERTNAVAQIDIAAVAFKNWTDIRETPEAQDYLLALFLPKPPRN